MKNIPFAILLFVAASCADSPPEEQKAASAAQAFADAYFNLELHRAQKWCTTESRQWLSFLASNVQQADLDVLNAEEERAEADVADVALTTDTTAVARIGVSRYLRLGDIGQQATMEENGDFTLDLVKRKGQWLVRMAGLPRNERHSRD